MTVREGGPSERSVCADIAGELPMYFTPGGLEQLGRDLESHDILVDEEGGLARGFLTIEKKAPAVWEISWLAVRPDSHGRGIGSQLISEAAARAAAASARLLEVKTQAPVERETAYERTRRFYDRNGFHLVEIIDPFPGWDPGNPCAIYVRPL